MATHDMRGGVTPWLFCFAVWLRAPFGPHGLTDSQNRSSNRRGAVPTVAFAMPRISAAARVLLAACLAAIAISAAPGASATSESDGSGLRGGAPAFATNYTCDDIGACSSRIINCYGDCNFMCTGLNSCKGMSVSTSYGCHR